MFLAHARSGPGAGLSVLGSTMVRDHYPAYPVLFLLPTQAFFPPHHPYGSRRSRSHDGPPSYEVPAAGAV